MGVFVHSATEDSLTEKRRALVELEEKITETEIKELTATSAPVKQLYSKLLAKQKDHLLELTQEVEELKQEKANRKKQQQTETETQKEPATQQEVQQGTQGNPTGDGDDSDSSSSGGGL